MTPRPFLPLCGYAAGVLLGSSGAGLDQLLSCALGGAGVIAAVVLWLRRHPRHPLVGMAPGAMIVWTASTAGAVSGAQAWQAAVGPPLRAQGERWLAARREGQPVVVEGRLRGDAQPTEYGASLVLDVDRFDAAGQSMPSRGGIRVSVSGAAARLAATDWRDGRRLRVPVILREPQPYQNPGLPNQTHVLALQGVTWLAGVKSAALVTVERPASPLEEAAAAARAYVRRAVGDAMRPGIPQAREPARAAGAWQEPASIRLGIVTAILVGDRAGIPLEVTERLQKAGTFHVIAISGGNIAMLTVIVLTALRTVRVPPRASAVVTAAAVGVYGVIASGASSVARATVVALICLSARALDVRPAGFAVLWSALLGLLLWSPLSIRDPGFLLTAGATIGILLSAPGLLRGRAPETWPRPAVPASTARKGGPEGDPDARRTAFHRVGWLRSIARATVAADLVLLPIATTLFSRVSVAGLVLNPLAIPLMGLAQLAGLAIVATSVAAPGVAAAAAMVAAFGVDGLLTVSALVERWPWLAWRVPPPGVVAIGVYYAAWLAWIVARRRDERRIAPASLTIALFCTLWIATAPSWLPSRFAKLPPMTPFRAAVHPPLIVVFLDVGQGDATLVRLPHGRAILVDAGGLPGASAFDVGARVVVPALWAMGTRRLEALALTHGDPDHIGGAAAVVADLMPHEMWDAIPVPGHPGLARVQAATAAHGVGWRRVLSGTRLTRDRVDFRVIHPPRPEWERRRVRNDDSLTLWVEYGSVRVLLPGDIGGSVEEQLARDFSRQEAGVTILKVAHHGSATSSAAPFLDALRPAVAVVSAGRGNRFGHPAREVIARYAARGIPLLRTDLLGATAVVTDGSSARAYAWSGAAWREVWRAAGPPPSALRGGVGRRRGAAAGGAGRGAQAGPGTLAR
jgi:competence protein ComEC